MKTSIFAICLATLAGCASTSGVQKIGPDTFLISTQVVLGPNKANSSRAAALTEAAQFCEKSGKELLVDNFSTTGQAMSLTGDSQVTFKCLARSDPDLKRPVYTPPPSTVIEVQDKRQTPK